MVPPEQRKTGVESTQDVFVTHRQRQKVKAYQDKMESWTLRSIAWVHICSFYGFLIAAEADGSLEKTGMAAAIFVLVSLHMRLKTSVLV